MNLTCAYHRSCQSFSSPSILGCTHAELLCPVFLTDLITPALTECTSTIKKSCLLSHHGLWTFSVDHYVTAWSGRPARIRSRTFVIAVLFLKSINLFCLLSCNNCFDHYICVMTYQIASFPRHVVSEIIRNVVTSISFEEAQQLRLVNRQTL